MSRRTWVSLVEPVTFQKGHVVRTAPAGTFVQVDVDYLTASENVDKTIPIHLVWQGVRLNARVYPQQVRNLV